MTYQIVRADRLRRRSHLPGVGGKRRSPGRARVVWDVRQIGCCPGRLTGDTSSPSSWLWPTLDLGLGTDARLGRVVILLVDVHLHLLFLEISEQKRSMFVG